MNAKEFIVYVIAQILGAIVGGIAIFGIAAMGGKELAGDACNAVLSDGAGGIIGAICGFKFHFKTQRQYQDVIDQIKDLKSEE